MDWIYLDNNATTRPAPQVVEALREACEDLWANPSSVHRFGQLVRQRIELAREQVARLVGCRGRELVFTSGGTESNNLALHGLLDAALRQGQKAVLLTTPVEHSAVREPAEALQSAGGEVGWLAVAGDGRVKLDALEQALAEHTAADLVLVSVQWANNETGVIQPVQAVGKLPVDLAQTDLDLMSFSAHKFHGPKGIGGLFVRRGVRLRAIQQGGPQEREKRGGTENTAGILGMGVAAELARAFLQDQSGIDRLRALRDRFEQAVLQAVPGAQANAGPPEFSDSPRLWNTSNIGFPRLEAEAILLALSERGLCASAGAACSSGSLEPSPVLRAMNVPEPLAHGSVRFSLSRFTQEEEIERAIERVPQAVARLARTMPVG